MTSYIRTAIGCIEMWATGASDVSTTKVDDACSKIGVFIGTDVAFPQLAVQAADAAYMACQLRGRFMDAIHFANYCDKNDIKRLASVASRSIGPRLAPEKVLSKYIARDAMLNDTQSEHLARYCLGKAIEGLRTGDSEKAECHFSRIKGDFPFSHAEQLEYLVCQGCFAKSHEEKAGYAEAVVAYCESASDEILRDVRVALDIAFIYLIRCARKAEYFEKADILINAFLKIIERRGSYPGAFHDRVHMQYEWALRSLRLGKLQDAALRLVDVVRLTHPDKQGELRAEAIGVLQAASNLCPACFAPALKLSKNNFLAIAVDSYLRHDLEAAKRCISLIADASDLDHISAIEYLALKSWCGEAAEPAIVDLCMSADKELLLSVRVDLDASFMKLAIEARLAGRFEECAHYLDAFEALCKRIDAHHGSVHGLMCFQLEKAARLVRERNYKNAMELLLNMVEFTKKSSKLSRAGEQALKILLFIERNLRAEEERLALLCKQRLAIYALSSDAVISEEHVAEYSSLEEQHKQIVSLLEDLTSRI